MSGFTGRIGIAIALAALGFGGGTAQAQSAAVQYWIPGWPMGFGGNLAAGQGMNSYGNFPSFDGSDARGGGLNNFPKGWFVSGQSGSMGLGMNGLASDGTFGSINYQGTQFGYNFQNSPLKIYGGFGTFKYDSGIGGGLAPFAASSTLPGYSAHAGVEYQASPNVSLSFGVGYTQQSGRVDTDTPSPALSNESPYSLVGHR